MKHFAVNDGLEPSHHEQDDYNEQYDTEDAAGSIAPAAGVRPYGQNADEHQQHDDQHNSSEVHDRLPLITAAAARAPGPTRRKPGAASG